MRIYSNKKRPVKASNDGRKWVNTEVTKAEWNKLRKFLKANGYQFEPSEAGSMVHVECYLNGEEIKEVDAYLDNMTDIDDEYVDLQFSGDASAIADVKDAALGIGSTVTTKGKDTIIVHTWTDHVDELREYAKDLGLKCKVVTDVTSACGKKSVKASNEGRSDLIYVIMVNGDPVAKGSYDAMVKKSYTYNYPVQMLKFPKAKLNSLMKMAKDAHRPDPLKFAVNRFINDYTDEYDSLNASCTKKSVKASYGGWGKFYGLNDVEFTVPNDMDDPTIFYNGKYYNYYAIEDTLWDYYKEDCDENGVIPDENDFENWVSTNSYLVYDLLAEISPKSEPGRGVYRREANTLRDPVKSSTNRRKAVKASYTVEIFTYDELTPEQQEYVINNWSNMSKLANNIYEWFNEDIMLTYPDELQYIADQYAGRYGLSINPDKIYWQSNSQGPYPEWDLSQVFDEYQLNDGTEIYFYGSGLDVEAETDSWGEEVESPEIDEVVGHAQEFIDKVWDYINDICQSYPDDVWVKETMESNPDAFEFTIDSDGNPKYY